MRRLFALILIALLAGVGVVAVIETDPGYVLVAYGTYTLETSLWVGLLLLVIFTLLVYALVRFVRRLLGGQNSIVTWLGNRKARQAARLTTRGLINFIEGNWQKSRRQLLRGARSNESPMINYLMAARASYQLSEPDKMREYLGAAEESESGAGIAVEITQAEVRLHARQFEQALATLVRARRDAGKHPYVLSLLHRAYLGVRDWQSLAGLLPELKKYNVMPAEELQSLEQQVYKELLGQQADSAEALRQQWQKTPADYKKNAALIRQYVTLLVEGGDTDTAEKLIVKSLKQRWDSDLIRLYGYVESASTTKQLSQAESWLPAHDNDAQLFLALGRMAARENLWGKARDYFENSYRLDRSAEICAELGRLLDALGEARVSAAYFREGMTLQESALPTIPLPQQIVPRTHQLAGRLN